MSKWSLTHLELQQDTIEEIELDHRKIKAMSPRRKWCWKRHHHPSNNPKLGSPKSQGTHVGGILVNTSREGNDVWRHHCWPPDTVPRWALTPFPYTPAPSTQQSWAKPLHDTKCDGKVEWPCRLIKLPSPMGHCRNPSFANIGGLLEYLKYGLTPVRGGSACTITTKPWCPLTGSCHTVDHTTTMR
jgi:hypothetical protein